MRLETKYGVLEGTVEEFKELLEGEKDLSYFSGKVDRYTEPTYKVVIKDTVDAISGVRVPKGLVLEHASRDWYTTRDAYTDTLGNLYMLSPKDLDDYNTPGIDERFKSLREEGKLLKQGLDKPTYYIVNKDDVVCFLDLNKKLPKGLVLEHRGNNAYEDTLGRVYVLPDTSIEGYNMPWVDGKFKSFKDKKLLLTQKEEYKVVTEDLYSNLEGLVMIEKGTILLETEYNYEDSLGNKYGLSSDTVENKLEGVYGDSVGLRFEEHKLNNDLCTVELP